jgi:hypothetical protein
MFSADIPECQPDQPNLTGGNKFDKAKTPSAGENRCDERHQIGRRDRLVSVI